MSVTVLVHEVVVARKRHACMACLLPIEPGTRYTHQRNVCDGAAYHWRAHTPCHDLSLQLASEWFLEDYDSIDPSELRAELAARHVDGCEQAK